MSEGVMPGDFLTPREACVALSLGRATLQDLIRRGILRVVGEGSGARVPRPSVEAFLQAVGAPSLRHPPEGEAVDLHAQCVAVSDDPHVARWLHAQGLDPAAVRRLDLARVLPLDAPSPAWAATAAGRWSPTGYRLILPLWDAVGRFTSLRAVGVTPFTEGRWADAQRARARDLRGLVHADMVGVALLRHPSIPPNDHDYAVAMVRRHGLRVAASPVEYLAEACRWSDAPERPAVLGVAPGAWTADLAAKVPDGTTVQLVGTASAARSELERRLRVTLAERLAGGGVALAPGL